MPGFAVATSAGTFTTAAKLRILRRTAQPTHGVEALLPGLDWVGFDPTINQLAREQHIRTATGRDYDDVPPTMGMMKGKADTELQVRVRVTPSQAMLLPQSAEAQQR